MEPDKLCHKCHVWICNLSLLSNLLEAILESNFVLMDHIAQTHSCWSWNTLYAVNVNSSSLLFGFSHEIDYLVEAALNVFSNMIFQMERQILDSFFYVIIVTVVCSTIDDMSDAIFSQFLEIFGYDVTSKIQKIIDDHRTLTIIHGIDVLISWGSSEIELLVQVFMEFLSATLILSSSRSSTSWSMDLRHVLWFLFHISSSLNGWWLLLNWLKTYSHRHLGSLFWLIQWT